MNKIEKICIITPGILASNPRVVKEAAALSEAGYLVHIIYTRHVAYLMETDQQILEQYPLWKVDYLDWAGNDLKARFIKIISGLKRRIANSLLSKGIYFKAIVPFLINRFYSWQLKKAIGSKADLYIAHYPESLAIAANAAKINDALFAYDAEDYHRGENLPEHILKAIRLTEDHYLKQAAYITAASPLIAKAYQQLYPNIVVKPIENVFPLKQQPEFRELNHPPYRFFWFSQTIGHSRGVEEFMAILGKTALQDIQLTLLGNVKEAYKEQLKQTWQKSGLADHLLIFKSTVPEREIFEIAAEHHFGLCLEIPVSINRDICITNKLYTYLLSGNVLVFSKTQAQENFLKHHPDAGLLIDLNQATISAENLLQVIESPSLIQQTRNHNYKLGRKQLNFDTEKAKLLDLLKQIRPIPPGLSNDVK